MGEDELKETETSPDGAGEQEQQQRQQLSEADASLPIPKRDVPEAKDASAGSAVSSALLEGQESGVRSPPVQAAEPPGAETQRSPSSPQPSGRSPSLSPQPSPGKAHEVATPPCSPPLGQNSEALASFAPPLTEKQQLPLLPSPAGPASPRVSTPRTSPRGGVPGTPLQGSPVQGSPMSDFKTPTGWSPHADFGTGTGQGSGYQELSPEAPKLGAHSVADQSLLAANSKAADGDEWRGWTIQTSPQGKLFYHHIASNTSQWQMPPELGPVLGEWAQVEEDGKRYWRNEKLGVSSWKDPRRTTNLFQAALDGNLFFLQLYTEVGGFLDAVDSKGRTALHYNCAGGSAQAVHYLLQHGASVDLLDRSGSTPLHWAARYGHAPIVRLLLESKAHPDFQNGMGDTAMHEAAALGLMEPLQWLVLAKANPLLRNRESRTPKEVAERASSKDVLQLLQQLEDEEPSQSESDAARARRRERAQLGEVTSPEPDPESGTEDEPSLALVVVRAARPILRSVQWLANRVLGEKKTNLGDTSQFSYDHLSGQWVLRRPTAEEESVSSEEHTWSLPETRSPRRVEESDGGMA